MTHRATVSNANRFEVRVTADSHFAWLRTRLAVERTMMSWLRTAVSLIGFGFAIVQFFERLEQMSDILRLRSIWVSHSFRQVSCRFLFRCPNTGEWVDIGGGVRSQKSLRWEPTPCIRQ